MYTTRMDTYSPLTKVLCYGDSNSWGWVPGKMGTERFDEQTRWPAVMRTILGQGYEVIEENLGARTTMFDDPRPEYPLRNGLETLPIILEVHAPVDIVILMLGTADCKPVFDAPAELIAGGMEQLILTVQHFRPVNEKAIAHVIVLAPPVINGETEFAQKVFAGSEPKTRALVPLYKNLAQKHNCSFLDVNPFVTPDAQEGIHITAESHKRLAKEVAKLVKAITLE
jgi:lysophospholipase L1-like esterase